MQPIITSRFSCARDGCIFHSECGGLEERERARKGEWEFTKILPSHETKIIQSKMDFPLDSKNWWISFSNGLHIPCKKFNQVLWIPCSFVCFAFLFFFGWENCSFSESFFPLFLGHLFFIFFDKSTYFFSEKIYVVYIYNVTIMVQVERLQNLGGKFCLLFCFLEMKNKKALFQRVWKWWKVFVYKTCLNCVIIM